MNYEDHEKMCSIDSTMGVLYELIYKVDKTKYFNMDCKPMRSSECLSLKCKIKASDSKYKQDFMDDHRGILENVDMNYIYENFLFEPHQDWIDDQGYVIKATLYNVSNLVKLENVYIYPSIYYDDLPYETYEENREYIEKFYNQLFTFNRQKCDDQNNMFCSFFVTDVELIYPVDV